MSSADGKDHNQSEDDFLEVEEGEQSFSSSSDEDFIDIETVDQPGSDYADEDDSEESSLDDEGFDFPGEERNRGAAGLKRMLVPLAVLLMAAGAGGYIVMNPSILGGTAPGPATPIQQEASLSVQQPGGNMPSPETVASADASVAAEASTSSPVETDMTPPPFADGSASSAMDSDLPPQPTANVNEAAVTQDPVDRDFSSAFEEPQSEGSMQAEPVDESAAVPSQQTAQIEEGDTTDDLAGGTAESTPFQDINPVTPTEQDAPVPASSSLATQTPAQETATPAPTTQMASSTTSAKSESVQEPVTADPSQPAQTAPLAAISADPVQPPQTESQPERMPEAPSKAVSSVNLTRPQGENKTVQPAATPNSEVDPNKYYDSTAPVPGGPLATTMVPRKVDPDQEPASKYVIVEDVKEPQGMEAQIVAANRALKLGMDDSALEMFNSLYDKNPRDSRILMGRAVALQNLGQTDAALKAYDEMLSIDPKNSDVLVNMLGVLRTQYPEVALRRLLDLHKKYPGNAAITAQVGITQAGLGHTNEALQYLGSAASMEPNNAQHIFNMAVISDRAGMKDKAVSYYERALEIDVLHGGGRSIPRDQIYDRLSTLRR